MVSFSSSPLQALLAACGPHALHINDQGVLTHAWAEHPWFKQGGLLTEGFAPEDAPLVEACLAQALSTGVAQLNARHPDGSPAHWLLQAYEAAGRKGLVAVQRGYQRPIDPLTGLPGRELLIQELETRLAQGACVLVLFNLRDFQQVNDVYGYAVGDTFLRELARRLKSLCPPGAFLARMGGDEFGLLMDPASVELVSWMRIAQMQLQAVMTHESIQWYPAVAIGACESTASEPNAVAVVTGATHALKRARRGEVEQRVIYAPEKKAHYKKQLELEAMLHQALALGELYLVYQPLVKADGRVYGAEALMRWQRADGSHVSPGEFIPVAERSGLIRLMGRWALKAACHSMAVLNQTHQRQWLVSVNVSAEQFSDPQFENAIQQALTLSQLPPELLQLEITESTLMSEPEAALELLRRLKKLGVRVALDDFGTGYSSLAYLKLFELAALKLDRSFVKGLPDAEDVAICRSVFALARELDIEAVAEGVETAQQWAILREAGCEGLQGFYFGKPQTLLEIHEYDKNNERKKPEIGPDV
jgi:diguanylate cyclase (GGDEF)-like protein